MSRNKRASRTPRKPTAARRVQVLKASTAAAVDALVKRATVLQARGRKLAVAKVREARAVAGERVVQVRRGTADAVGRLERAFQHRVSQAMSRLGVPNARDVRALSRQVAQLQQSVEQLRRGRARA
jgi:poly(hydroxyalkanoate) granule-associated protein